MTEISKSINQFYHIIERNQTQSHLSADDIAIYQTYMAKIDINHHLSALNDKDFFKLLVVQFYYGGMNNSILKDFFERFNQGFNTIQSLIEEHPFITFRSISQCFILNEQEKNKNHHKLKQLNSLLQHFCYLNEYTSLLNFFPEKETPLLETIQFNSIKNLNIDIYENVPLSFFITIFKHYGLNIKTESGSDVWSVASQFCRLDVCEWLEKEQVPYILDNIHHCSTFVDLMKNYHIFTDKYIQIYDFLFNQDIKYIASYQDEHVKLMHEHISYGNVLGIDYLINKNFDFSYPNFSCYLELIEDDTRRNHIYGRSNEEATEIKHYLRDLRKKIIEQEQNVILDNLKQPDSQKIVNKIKL
jgi:hypothetical protein